MLYETGPAKSEKIQYLSAKLQEQMASESTPAGEFVASLPWNHFARKNVGYLYAIAHGARLIFDFDDDNELKLPHLHVQGRH